MNESSGIMSKGMKGFDPGLSEKRQRDHQSMIMSSVKELLQGLAHESPPPTESLNARRFFISNCDPKREFNFANLGIIVTSLLQQLKCDARSSETTTKQLPSLHLQIDWNSFTKGKSKRDDFGIANRPSVFVFTAVPKATPTTISKQQLQEQLVSLPKRRRGCLIVKNCKEHQHQSLHRHSQGYWEYLQVAKSTSTTTASNRNLVDELGEFSPDDIALLCIILQELFKAVLTEILWKAKVKAFLRLLSHVQKVLITVGTVLVQCELFPEKGKGKSEFSCAKKAIEQFESVSTVLTMEQQQNGVNLGRGAAAEDAEIGGVGGGGGRRGRMEDDDGVVEFFGQGGVEDDGLDDDEVMGRIPDFLPEEEVDLRNPAWEDAAAALRRVPSISDLPQEGDFCGESEDLGYDDEYPNMPFANHDVIDLILGERLELDFPDPIPIQDPLLMEEEMGMLIDFNAANAA